MTNSLLEGTKTSNQPTLFIYAYNASFTQLGEHSFSLDVARYLEEDEEYQTVSYLQLTVPIKLYESPQALTEKFNFLANNLPFLCGTAGFLTHRLPYSSDITMKKLSVIAKNYP